MDPAQKKIPPVKGKPPRVSESTIMIMGSIGKVRTFKISRRFIFSASLFFILYIVVSIFVINDYFDLRSIRKTQTQRIRDLEKEMAKDRKALYRGKQHIALLKDYIQHFEEQQHQEQRTTKVEGLKGQEKARNRERPEKGQGKPTFDLVDVREMVIQKEGSRITVDFKVVNIQQGEEPAGGYIHIIAMGKNANPPQEWAFPREEIRGGVPVNFRSGQLFLIQRFKPIQGRFQLSPHSDAPTSIKVLVYDQSGKLVLEKVFEVSNVS